MSEKSRAELTLRSAVRDKEGNALRNSHVVGFFRRICKLLFFGIKPVFVFDGGAPTLKRQTISARKDRREGRREDAVRTAGKLLALQMQRHAEDEDQRRREAANHPAANEEEPLPEHLVYVDELQMTQKERQQTRSFRKKDQYHLPELDVPLSEMGGPNDPRVMSMEELETYARQFDTGEDINVYDFSKIDFDSPFFTSLPAADRYNILNAARLRSRLRMGLSKDQLDTMFPNRMDFSRFQIERVRERNELTARLMNINNGDADWDTTGGRIAGEKGREYFLVKNPGVEGGWALGVVGDRDKDEGRQAKPIDVDEDKESIAQEEPASEESSGDERENHEEVQRRRRAFYESRGKLANPHERQQEAEPAPDSMFVDETTRHQDGGVDGSDEEADLQGAIALSLEVSHRDASDEDEEFERVFNPKTFQQKRAEDFNPFSKSSLGHVAQVANNRARRAAPTHAPVRQDSDDEMDLSGALAESCSSKRKPSSPARRVSSAHRTPPRKATGSGVPGGSSALPFEKLNLGVSLLGKKKMDKIEKADAGGFDKMEGLIEEKKNHEAAPLPPWFDLGDIVKDVTAQRKQQIHARKLERQREDEHFEFEANTLRKQQSGDVIDVDEYDNQQKSAVITLDSSDEGEGEDEDEDGAGSARRRSSPAKSAPMLVEDPKLRMGDVADKVRVEPPAAEPALSSNTERADPSPGLAKEVNTDNHSSLLPDEPIELGESDREASVPQHGRASSRRTDADESASAVSEDDVYMPPDLVEADQSRGQLRTATTAATSSVVPPIPSGDRQPARSQVDTDEDSADDVYMPPELQDRTAHEAMSSNMLGGHDGHAQAAVPSSGLANQTAPMDDEGIEGEDDFSDPEEEELMIAMANEAEEHARFASQLNKKTQQQNIEEYERELKALRTQQKKDRRDADEVTQIMITECQQLLKLFGLPYITAPMEAEAQCAELVQLGLVDGIVTDDSDTFLFGGTRVYKNMFNQAKFVECYLAGDLEKEFDLTRDKLINIAHLLGSDYTEGLPGVGPVKALEIVGEFPDLRDFKVWWNSVQSTMKPEEYDQGSAFRKKFRKANATKLFLPNAFPDLRVNEAYHRPEVDSDASPFQWGVPDLDALRSFLMATIGWSQERTDEVLVPVIRDMNRRETEGTQANITSFVSGGSGAGAFAPRVREGKSKRMEGALNRMAQAARSSRRAGNTDVPGEVSNVGDGDVVDAEDAVIAIPGSAAASTEGEARARKAKAEETKRHAAKRRQPNISSRRDVEDESHDEAEEDAYEPPTKKRKAAKSRRKKTRDAA